MDRVERLLATDGLILLREHPELRSALYRTCREGRLTRLHPGVFVAAGPVPDQLRLLALSRWAPRAVLHSTTAAQLWLGEWNGGTVQLASPVTLVHPGWVRLTLRRVPTDQVGHLGGIRVARPAYCAAELAATDDGRCAMRMFAEGLVSLGQLEVAAGALAGTADNAVRQRVVADLAANPWSPAERILHQLLRSAGIGGWLANASLVVGGQRVRPDVLLAAARLVIEVDGWAFHSGRAEFQRDRERQNLLAQAGYTVLRFTWQDLTERPSQVVTMIRRTLAARNLQLDPFATA